MKYEDLDTDTQGIIEAMAEITGKTKAKCILVLIEFGMLSMKAAVSADHLRIMEIITKAVNQDPKLKQLAGAYDAHWRLPFEDILPGITP